MGWWCGLHLYAPSHDLGGHYFIIKNYGQYFYPSLSLINTFINKYCYLQITLLLNIINYITINTITINSTINIITINAIIIYLLDY